MITNAIAVNYANSLLLVLQCEGHTMASRRRPTERWSRVAARRTPVSGLCSTTWDKASLTMHFRVSKHIAPHSSNAWLYCASIEDYTIFIARGSTLMIYKGWWYVCAESSRSFCLHSLSVLLTYSRTVNPVVCSYSMCWMHVQSSKQANACCVWLSGYNCCSNS